MKRILARLSLTAAIAAGTAAISAVPSQAGGYYYASPGYGYGGYSRYSGYGGYPGCGAGYGYAGGDGYAYDGGTYQYPYGYSAVPYGYGYGVGNAPGIAYGLGY